MPGRRSFWAVKIRDVNRNAGLFLERREGVRRYVVGPDKEIDDLVVGFCGDPLSLVVAGVRPAAADHKGRRYQQRGYCG